MRLVIGSIAFLALVGCATLYSSSTPTQIMVEAQLEKTKKVVVFSSSVASQEIEDLLVNSSCGNETKTFSNMTTAGPGAFVGTSTTAKFSVERGVLPDDSHWIVLRARSGMSSVPAGVQLVARSDGGTDVRVLAADSRKIGQIKQTLEDGTLFCHWREFNYPYD